jgi:hypothetical protein
VKGKREISGTRGVGDGLLVSNNDCNGLSYICSWRSERYDTDN